MANIELFNNDKNKTETKTEGYKKPMKFKEFIKQKPFLIAVLGVSIVAIFVLLTKKSQPQQEEESEAVLQADGYDYLTYTGSGSGSQIPTDVYDDMFLYYATELETVKQENQKQIEELTSEFEKAIEVNKNAYDVEVDNMSNEILQLTEKLDKNADTILQQQEAIERQNDINTMRNNADAWHVSTNEAYKESLHKANESIADKWGWTFNDASGYWADENGNALFSTVMQESYVSSGVDTGSLPSYTSPSTGSSDTVFEGYGSSSGLDQKTLDIMTMKANSEAWHDASDDEKVMLSEANKQIASKYGFTFDDDTGYWYEGDTKVYTPTVNNSGSNVNTGELKSGASVSKAQAYNSGASGSLSNGYYSGTLSGKKIV